MGKWYVIIVVKLVVDIITINNYNILYLIAGNGGFYYRS